MVSVLWSTTITCCEAGCKWNTSMGADLKETLKSLKKHTEESHSPTMRRSTATTTVVEYMKKELLSFLECPVCLSYCKPPLQVYTFCLSTIDHLFNFPLDLAMSGGSYIMWHVHKKAGDGGLPSVPSCLEWKSIKEPSA